MIRSVGLPHKSVFFIELCPWLRVWLLLGAFLYWFVVFALAHGCHRTRAAVVVHCLFALVGELARAGTHRFGGLHVPRRR